MNSNTTRFYLDTNALVDARQYLHCRNSEVPSRYFTESIKGGKALAEGLELVRAYSRLMDVRTSDLARFEMNSVYQRWLALDVLMDVGLPIHSLGGDGAIRQLQNHAKLIERYELKITENESWITKWDYADVVSVAALDASAFEIAKPMQSIAREIQLVDALHLANAIAMGADFLVTSDRQFTKASRLIVTKFRQDGKLPNGQPFEPVIELITPTDFKNKTKHIVVRYEHSRG
jgi:predicted nucleic acid-binding protein